MNIYKKLNEIQKTLNAPKSKYNSFGKYNYRSCEDILDGLKKHLGETYVVLLSDEIIEVGGRLYVKATASFTDGSETVSVSALAREALDKKGMDDSQITGSTSSYARKYALNGLFAIDDTNDADAMDNSKSKPTNTEPITKEQSEKIKDLLEKKGRTWKEVATTLNILGTNISKIDANRLIEHLVKLPEATLH